jgi:hypothetical protein
MADNILKDFKLAEGPVGENRIAILIDPNDPIMGNILSIARIIEQDRYRVGLLSFLAFGCATHPEYRPFDFDGVVHKAKHECEICNMLYGIANQYKEKYLKVEENNGAILPEADKHNPGK